MSLEVTDVAAALRAMADNVDVIAERHDVKDMAQLRLDAEQHEADRRRDADLIDELRRQVESMGRSLDAISRLRGTDIRSAVTIFGDALVLLAGDRCSTFTSGSCRSDTSGKTRGAKYGADAWCSECIARDALERAGALPPAVD